MEIYIVLVIVAFFVWHDRNEKKREIFKAQSHISNCEVILSLIRSYSNGGECFFSSSRT